MFDNLHRDIVTLIKENGVKYENIKANVQTNKIFINDGTLPIDEGDRFVRVLPSKLVESYIVIDRGFYSAVGGIKDHYQVKVKKESNTSEKDNKSNTINNFYGDMTNTQIQQDVNNSSQSLTINEDFQNKDELFKYMELLAENIDNLNLAGKELGIIRLNIDEINNEMKKEIVHKKNVKEGLSTIRNILEGITGSLIASGLIYQLDKLVKWGGVDVIFSYWIAKRCS